MKKHIFFFLVLWVYAFSRLAASVEVRSTHMTTSNGLANNSIRHIYQDSKGFMWFGTLNGLSRYDGTSFVTFRPGRGEGIALADHRIRILEEDKNGFLWIATTPDLYSCYNLKEERFVDFTGCGEYKQNYGYHFIDSKGDIWLWQEGNGCRKVTYGHGQFASTVFKKKLKNIPTDLVKYVFEDGLGNIWIGSKEGVFRVEDDKTAEKATDHDAFKALAYGDKVFFLSADGQIVMKKGKEQARILTRLGNNGKGTLVYGMFRLQTDWMIFTADGGYIVNLNTHKVRVEPAFNIKRGEVQTDNRGNFWVYNHTGKVWYVNAQTREVKTFQLIPADKVSYIDLERYHIVHDSRDIIWISTYGNGLFAYDLAAGELQHFSSSIDGFSHISSDFLHYVMEDRSGGIWVSSEYTGLSLLSVLNEGALRIFPEDKSLADRSNAVRMLTCMTDGRICLGTRRGGLYTYSPDLTKQEESRSYKSNIYAAVYGLDGSSWLGSRGNGLSIDGKWYVHKEDNPASLANDNIFSICRDREGRMWIGTFGGGLDLAVKDGPGGTYTFRHFLHDTYSQRQIHVVTEDRNGWIWVGASSGIYVFHPDSLLASPKNYHAFTSENGKLRSNEIKCIWQDSQGTMWIGTTGSGFSTCTPKGNYGDLTFTHYGTGDGLVNNMVQSIVEDWDGKMWIATEYGVSRFDPQTRLFENFFFSTYSLGNVYNENSGCLSRDGRVLFGSNYGLVVITPKKIGCNASKTPEAAFTNLLINGISIRPGDADSPLEHALIYTDNIKLKYYQNSFAVEFSTFDYSSANVAKYIYRLENYDKEWSVPSSLNFAAYKNLPPGNYKLRVKACNETGIWSGRESVLVLTVTPPFWKTTWAFLFYLLLLILALYIAYRLIKDFNSLRNRIQVEKQLTEYKLVFFTNISHEFRTPLTLIQGTLDRMKRGRNVPKNMRYSISILEKSTQRMLRLINQLLEFRKMQNNKLALSLEETDVIAFLHEIYLIFSDAAKSKRLIFKFIPSVESYKMYIDKGYVDKVTYNLLSNAFKYTQAEGEVDLSVKVDEKKKQLVISVSDTGVGIPKDKQGELFKRFMQSSFSGSSMGVGLHLSHELVNVHKGSIVFQEHKGGGSIFTVTLPLGIDQYEPKDFLIPHNVLLEEEEKHHADVLAEEAEDMEDMGNEDEEITSEMPLNKNKVLVIEDDDDVREFLKKELEHYFEVVVEPDGISGLERARSYDADLVICDVLMPGMDGFEVTRKLKNDFDTSHIPVILLTAMTSDENHLEGVNSGADAYITKPFSTKLLLARASNLIAQREKLKQKFSSDPNVESSTICTSNQDKAFLNRLQRVMNTQLTNSQFTVEEFATLVGLKRTLFYKKVKGLTGYRPNEYIRVSRLKKAADLLIEGNYSVGEITYMVGINDPFYFSKLFKLHFGVSPKDYVKSVKANGSKEKEEKGKETEEETKTKSEEKNDESANSIE